MSQPRIAIIGAGIAGLAAAAACRQRSLSFQLFDVAQDPLQGGAALTLWPNALSALQRLGLFDVPPAWMNFIESGDLRTPDNSVLYRLPLDWMMQTYGFAPTCVQRTDLTRWLWEQIGRPSILRAHVESVEADSDGARVYFRGGKSASFDGAIAADGIHSVVRQQWAADATRSTSYTAWRGIARNFTMPQGVEPQSMREYWGKGIRFGYAAIGPSRVYWFATLNNHFLPEDRMQWWPTVVERLQSFPDLAASLIQATPQGSILQHAIRDVRPGIPMSLKALSLIGDAAHAVTPNLGLGGCLALEDAAAMLDCLAPGRPLPVSFREYAAIRHKRVARIVRFTRLLGEVMQWEQGVLTATRNVVFRLSPDRAAHAVWRVLLGSNRFP
ncbi:FAD-dependent monooxygenase [Alicyclobacillus tolerans]|uniref:FAD-dependent monooxygenase n=1 Tax=Alicyclobacillus tolerans TaxID=90970 RepID=UPI001F0101EC|nr:FAD-dependent monooxygenase [Alicyclobacillus tolerans]MCF8564121.1 FAD-dependent monooxygenase [Alicyclobacillus tolerans]